MRCLYCGKRLSLLYKLSGREFCTEEHRAQYLQDQESLGLARLIETKRQSDLTASPRPKGRARPKRRSGIPPVSRKFFPEPMHPQSSANPVFLPGEPIAHCGGIALPPVDEMTVARCRVLQSSPRVPTFDSGSVSRRALPVACGTLPFPGAIELPLLPLSVPETKLVAPTMRCAAGLKPCPAAGEPPGERVKHPCPAAEWNAAPVFPAGSPAPGAGIPLAGTALVAKPAVVAPVPPLPVDPAGFTAKESLLAAPCPPRSPVWEIEEPPAGIDPEKITGDFIHGYRPACSEAAGPRPVMPSPSTGSAHPVIPSAHSPAAGAIESGAPAGLPIAVPAGGPVMPTSALVNIEPEGAAVRPEPVTPPATPSLVRAEMVPLPAVLPNQGPGCSLSAPEPARPRAFLLPPPDLEIHRRARLSSLRKLIPLPAAREVSINVRAAPALSPRHFNFSAGAEPRMPEAAGNPASPGLFVSADPADTSGVAAPDVPPPVMGAPPEPAEAMGRSVAGNVTRGVGAPRGPLDEFGAGLRGSLKRPGLIPFGVDRILALDGTGIQHGEAQLLTSAVTPLLPVARLETIPEAVAPAADKPAGPPLWKRAWGPVVAQWKQIPAGVKWSAIAAPLVVALLLHTLSRPVTVAADTSKASVSAVLVSRWQTLRENIVHRAAISLADDFRSGLGEWEGKGNWGKTWSYDKAGFVLPGQLALYRPSVALADYRFRFAAQIEKRSVNWVFRATDPENYYAAKLVITEPGPLPRGVLVHYAVIRGKKGRASRTRIPLRLRNGKMYEIEVDARGSGFTIQIDGRVVDFFRDDRLPRGGVGFFSGRGDRARLRWISVMHQYDFLGRICALVAPYNIENPEGGVKQ